MNKSALATSRPHEPSPVDQSVLGDDTIPSTPYTPRNPRNPYAPPGSSRIRRRPMGDLAGEHLYMRRGRFSAWPHVVVAFVYQTALIGALCAAPVWLAADGVALPDTQSWLALAAFVATGPAAAFFTFRHRWRVIEAYASRYCVGLLNVSLLYVPLVAFFYANVRAVQKLQGH